MVDIFEGVQEIEHKVYRKAIIRYHHLNHHDHLIISSDRYNIVDDKIGLKRAGTIQAG